MASAETLLGQPQSLPPLLLMETASARNSLAGSSLSRLKNGVSSVKNCCSAMPTQAKPPLSTKSWGCPEAARVVSCGRTASAATSSMVTWVLGFCWFWSAKSLRRTSSAAGELRFLIRKLRVTAGD